MFNPFKKPTKQEPEKNFRIMQNQVTGKFFIQKKNNQGNWRNVGKDGNTCWVENSLYFDTPAEAEIKINEFKKQDEQEELRKNPKIIRYV